MSEECLCGVNMGQDILLQVPEKLIDKIAAERASDGFEAGSSLQSVFHAEQNRAIPQRGVKPPEHVAPIQTFQEGLTAEQGIALRLTSTAKQKQFRRDHKTFHEGQGLKIPGCPLCLGTFSGALGRFEKPRQGEENPLRRESGKLDSLYISYGGRQVYLGYLPLFLHNAIRRFVCDVMPCFSTRAKVTDEEWREFEKVKPQILVVIVRELKVQKFEIPASWVV